MMNKVFISTLIVLFYTTKLMAQPWIPRLNNNGTYSLVTEKGKLVNAVAYDYVTPLWEGEQYAYWQSKGQVGYLFPNKVSITFKPIGLNSREPTIKRVVLGDKNNSTPLKDYTYLMCSTRNNLLVNTKTGEYVEDDLNDENYFAVKAMPTFKVRNGIIKIHKKDDFVLFLDLNFKMILPNPIKNGEMVTPDLFIAKDPQTHKFGLINSKGNIIAPYMYDKMYLTPNENHIVVKTTPQKTTRDPKNKFGLLDTQGKLVLDTIYSEIELFEKNFYIVRMDYVSGSGVLNQFLEPVIPIKKFQGVKQTEYHYKRIYRYLYVDFWSDNYQEENFMVFDTNCNMILKTVAPKGYRLRQECNLLEVNLANGEKSIYSTNKGIQFVFRDTFKDVFCLQGMKDTFLVRLKKGVIQLYARNGQKINTYPHDAVLPLNSIEGYYVAQNDDKYGIITPSGEIIVPIVHDAIFDKKIKGRSKEITFFIRGKDEKYGIYDKKLQKWTMFNTESEAIKYLYPPEFKIITGANNQYGVVRQNGKPVIPAQYQSIQQIKDSPIFTCYDNTTQKWHIIGEKNNIIFTFEKSEAQLKPVAHIIKSTGDYAIRTSTGTVFIEKDTYKFKKYINLLYVDNLCAISYGMNEWITLFDPNKKIKFENQIWVNYLTGKAYFEE